MRERKHFSSMGLAIMLLALAGMAQGAAIYQNITMPTTNSPNWNSTGFWSPDIPPIAGNTYWVGTTDDGVTRTPGSPYNARIQCRTPNNPAADQTFAGDKLIINGTSATLMMKSNSTTKVIIPDLETRGAIPRIECGNSGVLELAGNLNNMATNYLNFAVTDTANQRHIKLTAKVTGPGHIRVEGGNAVMNFADHAVIFDNNLNDFTGRVYTSNNGKIIVNQPKGLGNTSTVTLANRGQLMSTVPLDLPTVALVINAGGLWTINQTPNKFKAIRLPNDPATGKIVQVPPGLYQAADIVAMNSSATTISTGFVGTVEVMNGFPDFSLQTGGVDVTTVTFVNHQAVWGPALTQVLTLKNTGYAPLTFNPWYSAGGQNGLEMVAGSNPMYTISNVTPVTPTLAPGASMQITVRMSGTAADYVDGGNNNSTGTLRIRTDALRSYNVAFPIRGNTVPVEMSTFSAQ